jgi:asparagine synthetase B (glutamine-hydrolysing)
MDKSIDKRLKGNQEKTLIPLSGGLDSRWMVARAHELGVNPISSFTMGSPESEDRKYAHLVAESLNINQKFFDINAEAIWDDAKQYSYVSDAMSMIYGPIQNFQPYRSYKSKKHTIIAPQMCDAIFGSTLFKKKPKTLITKSHWDNESENILENIFSIIDTYSLKRIFQQEFYKKINNQYLEASRKYIEKDKMPIYCYFKLLMNEHGRRGTLGGNIVNNLFFETRMPSYDNDLMEFAFRVPIHLKQNQLLYRYTFSRKYRNLATIQRQGTNLPINVSNLRLDLKQLENKIINRAKKTKLNSQIMKIGRWNKPSYIQYANWFRKELRMNAESMILNNKTLERGIFNENGIKAILYEHLNGQADHFRLIWQIINLEYFYRNFID